MGPEPHAATRHPMRDWADLSVLVVVWGSSFALTKVAVGEVAPVWVVAWRVLLATAVLIPVLLISGGGLSRRPRDWAGFAWLAFVGTVAPFWLISWGTQYISSSLAGVLMAAVPLVVIVMAAALLKDEPLTVRKGIGFVAGFAGVVVLIGPGALLSFDAGNMQLLGALAVVSASLGYASQAVTVRLMRPMAGLERATGMIVASSAMALPLALVTAPDGYAAERAETLASLALLGIFPTAIAGIVLFPLIASAGAGFTALTNYLVPAFALAVGVTFLGEHFTTMDFAGFAMVLAGITVARPRHRPGGARS
ncbi:DMT family transporter [Rhodobium gokarnense]|uniref:Drug/metabolite transporter (DMT)-like permease n=1 Tax=Rhodobium gokarnense TaxID=364296 RepID=A0ABT3H744_9HYPH|nr:DMT family transporter [Rhodobium gokarnense]MCW2306200.1 drug/metabolite transporter (DMT)-like permease [Rhodobium gokarnense]